MYFSSFNPIESLLFAGAPLYLETGILVHWFMRMEHRIAYDPLLHIYNRDYCSKIISEQSNLNLMFPLSIAMVDIDHFKNVTIRTDTRPAIRCYTPLPKPFARKLFPMAWCAVYGGEELLFSSPANRQTGGAACGKNEENNRKTATKTTKKTIRVTVSCGISCKEGPGQSIIDVIHAADKALYKAKESGPKPGQNGENHRIGSKEKISARFFIQIRFYPFHKDYF